MICFRLFAVLLLLVSVDAVRAATSTMILYGEQSDDPTRDIITLPFDVDVHPDLPRNPDINLDIGKKIRATLPGLTVAAQQGKAAAILNYGVLQLHGWEVPQDQVAARQALDKAASLGVAEALVWQGDLSRNADGSLYDGAAAKPFYESAAAKGSTSAKYRLYQLYAFGNGVTADPQKAKAYLAELVAENLSYAQYYQAQIYRDGSFNTPPDKAQAKALMQLAAAQNYGPALLSLGDLAVDEKAYPKAMDYFQKAWAQSYTDAGVYIGRMVREGQSVKADIKESVSWFVRAAEAGNGWAMGMLARAYRRGDAGVAQDYALAKSWAEKGADVGNAIAEVQLALIYQDGLGVPKNERIGYDWWVRAANRGQPDALCNLGQIFERGQLVTLDRARARNLMAAGAAGSNNPSCASRAAFLYSSGNNSGISDEAQRLTPDAEKFKHFAQMAAQRGDVIAKNLLARCMAFALDGCKRDPAAAMAIWQELAKQGDAYAISGMAELYMVGRGVAKDEARAMALFKRPELKDYPDAIHNLGMFYSNGLAGMKIDNKRANEYFEKAAKLGSAGALRDLALQYRLGRGVPPDKIKALDYLRQAANLGDGLAAVHMGQSLRDDPSLPRKDKSEILDRFKRGAALGHAHAEYELGFDSLYGHLGPANDSEAFRYFSIAAEKGVDLAQNSIGMMYWTGRGVGNEMVVPIDYTKARYWFERAVKQGEPHAMISLATMQGGGIGGAKDVVAAYAHMCLAGQSTRPLEPERMEGALKKCRAIGERLPPDMLARGKAMIAAFKPIPE
jgi:uncharacterized protein